MNTKKLSLKTLLTGLRSVIARFRPYSFLAFLIFMVLLYGFVMFRINSLNTVQPSSEAVSQQVQAAQTPHIDEAVVKQLESLQDNSVSVQALFDEARSNPF